MYTQYFCTNRHPEVVFQFTHKLQITYEKKIVILQFVAVFARWHFLKLLKTQFRKNPYILHDRPLCTKYTTFVFGLAQLSGEIFTFKYEYPIEQL